MSGEMIAQLSLVIGLVLVAALICGTALAAWRGWLAYKRLELQHVRSPVAVEEADAGDEDTGARIELAAVKERLRRLEAIASGVEL